MTGQGVEKGGGRRRVHPVRVGQGFDVHQLVPDRPLWLGGVEIPHDRGLEGHSDADVLLHAIMDAILGAVGLPDIGVFFPNTDPQFKNIASRELLSRVGSEVRRAGFVVGNLDATVLAEAPKVGPFVASMKEVIAKALEIEPHQIGIKATTMERLGSVGRREGIAAMAVALLFDGE
jgi:2-C-methyl-D-erythritol 2,4-cyclodiphosphate synthase